MNKLNRAQKDKVRRFAAVADASEDVALKILKDARWDLEVGLEAFFTMPTAAAASSTDPAVLEALYAKYRAEDDDEDMIGAAGIEQLCEDIGIDPIDPVILVVSLKMDAASMGKYTKEEFMGGMRKMGVDSAAKLRAKLPALRAELRDERKFKEVYEYSFNFSKELNQKSLPLETASAMWKVLLTNRWALVDEWCEFLAAQHDKAITHDTWSQALEFSKAIGPDLEGYDPAGAWPYLIDEFVEHKLEAKNKGNDQA
mmetsp:Transcript_35956/g.57833  ORF Transcript_35956/g.57833 Transcript_35956/m.57833 type:complete len:256 (+) Transcript_35956:146-913(+)